MHQNIKAMCRIGHVDGVILDAEDHKLAFEMRNLYLECVSHLLCDDTFRVHVLLVPGMWTDHFVVPATEDPDLDQAVERFTGNSVGPLDMIVIMGKNLSTTARTEDEMTEIVVADISEHINRLWPIADRSSGWVGPHLGWACIAGMLTTAHPILKEHGHGIDQIRAKTVSRVMSNRRYKSVQDFRDENGCSVVAINRICDRLVSTNGEYIAVPARVVDLVEAGRTMCCEIIDEMSVRPIGIV